MLLKGSLLSFKFPYVFEVYLYSKEYGLEINTIKIKVMVITKSKNQCKINLMVDGTKLEKCNTILYIGSLLTEGARCQGEIQRRLAMGEQAFLDGGELVK